MKKVLIVSPHFPPINAPDMQRVRMSLGHYRAGGWEPVVLCVGERWQDGTREPELLQTVPADVRVVATRALASQWTKRLGIGNVGLRSWFHLRAAGNRLLAAERFDLVFFSTTQFITFTLGPLWRRRFGVPYALDVQDPWRTDYYERAGSRSPPGGWKYRFARLQARLFEGPCFRRAGAIMSVSPSYLEDLRARYPETAALPSAVIRFGASREDFAHAAALPNTTYPFDGDPRLRHLAYTGASGPVMPHSLEVLFGALQTYRGLHPARAERLRFHFVGTSYVPPGAGKATVLPVAEAFGVADLVSEVAHRVGFLDCARIQRAAHGLLLLGSSDLAYSPSKVYFYYLAGRPILGVVFQDSVMERILDELRCAHMARFRLAGPKEDAHRVIMAYFDGVLDGFPPEATPPGNDAVFNSNYLVEKLALRQCELFEQAARP
jgi:hypothetical protein